MKYTTILFLIFLTACQTKPNDSKKSIDSDEAKPNIIVIVADDMGFGDLGVYGSEIQTPHIDDLASGGIQFSNFHMGAACSPSRTMLITGVDNHRAGLGNMLEIMADNQFDQPGYEGYLNENVVSIATRIRDNGYHTYMVGKWHLGKSENSIPYARGFDRSFALMESGADNWVQQPYAPLYTAVHYYEDEKEVQLPEEDYFSSDYYTDKVISYMRENQVSEKPFFAYVAYQAVHMPHQAPKEFIDKYNGVYDNGWAELRKKRLARQKELGLVSVDVALNETFEATSYNGWKIPDWDALSEEEKKYNARRMQTYAGMVDNMDYNVGRIIDYLKESGQYENTLILFVSDNGADPNVLPTNPNFAPWYKTAYDQTYIEDYRGDYANMGQKGSYSSYGPGWAAAANTPNSYYKTFSTEGGMRVPFIVSYPNGIKSNRMTAEFGFVIDIAPTLLDAAGVKNYTSSTYNQKEVYPISGRSMWHFLTQSKDFIHEESETIGYELAGSSAIFKGDFKLMKNPLPKGNGEWELYNIIEDPSELNDLADTMPELTNELIAAYKAYEEQNGVIPVPDDYNPVTQLAKNASHGGHH